MTLKGSIGLVAGPRHGQRAAFVKHGAKAVMPEVVAAGMGNVCSSEPGVFAPCPSCSSPFTSRGRIGQTEWGCAPLSLRNRVQWPIDDLRRMV